MAGREEEEMMRKYEFTYRYGDGTSALFQEIKELGQEGWRLVTIIYDSAKGKKMAALEREITES